VKILGCGRPGLGLSLVVRLSESRLSEKWKSPILGDEHGRRLETVPSPRLSGQLLLLEARADEPLLAVESKPGSEEATRRRGQQSQAAFGSGIEESKMG